MIDFKNKVLFKFFSKQLEKNKKFKNLHNGESCYVFGNGGSLKNYDMKVFDDRVSIGCGSLFSHKDISCIDLRYYYIGHPLFFYYFWKNPYSGKYEKNKVGEFYRNKMSVLDDVEFFTSLSNYYGMRGNNINYVYHFGQMNHQCYKSDIDGVFTMMAGSLLGMIGIALYMGFKEITLVGCDYTCSPMRIGHFFEYGNGVEKDADVDHNKKIFDLLDKDVLINTVTVNDKYKGLLIPSVLYQDLAGKPHNYMENESIVSEVDLLELGSMNMPYEIFGGVDF